MAYRKFDDPKISVDNSAMKVSALKSEVLKRAIMGSVNRVLCGTSGAVSANGANLGTAATGICTQNAVIACINGQAVTIPATNNINLGTGNYSGAQIGKGTMGTNCVTKFLVFADENAVVDVAGPGNIVDKGDYANATLAAAACALPDLPEGAVALGYLTLQGPAGSGVTFNVGGAGTMGTCSFVNLFNMPYEG